ncbi:MAG: cytochrome P460 family protein [Gammaproteobacteria bacterium]|nr:cytochrome P460 family protein [Gammaproteobacteria bacterium]
MKSLIPAMLGMVCTIAALADDNAVPYPEGYRDWHHVKSMLIEQGHPLHAAFGGIHHIYANDKALAGYRAGQFADGAVIIFDLLETTDADHAITEGPRKVVGVMHKDVDRFASTGGWGFEGFAGGDPARRVVGRDAATACFACHEPQRERDYLFSQLRD